ncbi:MAG: RNA polymerase sigma factor [Planctomycetota bacterium]
MPGNVERWYETVLVLRCQAGDEGAFGELVDRYGPRLRYFLRKLLGEVELAEDALQDVWLDVIKSVARLAEPAAFSTWIYRIARDRAYRALRRRRHRSMEDRELAASPRDDEEFSREDAERIHDSLNQLAPEHREVLVLRFLEEMAYDQIAQVIGCRLGTVKSRIFYAKAALKRILERSEGHV